MASPFPGMDPYLEGELWGTFHAQFAVEIAHALNPLLTPRYVAVPEKYQIAVGPEEISIAVDPKKLVPDIGVARTIRKGAANANAPAAVLTAPFKVDTIVTIPVKHVWIKILDVKRRQLVTAIEILSPWNKQARGRKKYLRRRRGFLLSQAHFMEIDLLRKGRRIPMAAPLPKAAYFIFLCRAGQRPSTDVWPIAMDQRLPEVDVPLLPSDNDVTLDLQQVFERVYDLGGMEYLIEYGEQPDIPLPPDWAAWADERLRIAGKRSRRRTRGS